MRETPVAYVSNKMATIRMKQVSALAFSGYLHRFTPSLRLKAHLVSRNIKRKHGSRGKNEQKSFKAAGRLLVAGGVFLWDRERVHDWEVDE